MPDNPFVGKLNDAKEIAKRRLDMHDTIDSMEENITEEEEKIRVKEYFRTYPDATISDVYEDIGPNQLSKAQISGIKGGVVSGTADYEGLYQHFLDDPRDDISRAMEEYGVRNRERAKGARRKAWNELEIDKNDKENMTEEDTPDEISTSEAVEMLMNKVGKIEELEDEMGSMKEARRNRDEHISDIYSKLSEIESSVNANDGVIDAIREDINELKEMQDDEQKRYVGKQETITLELTDFEAMFIANRLWEAGEAHSEIGEERAESEAKMWARKIHGERNTRD